VDHESGGKAAQNAWILWTKDGSAKRQSEITTTETAATAAATATSAGPATATEPEHPIEGADGRATAQDGVRAPGRVAPTAPKRHLDPIGTELQSIISDERVEVMFQPIVELVSGKVVGFEALARGPEGPLRSPGELFAAAHAIGLAGELDWICRAAAFRSFLDAHLPPAVSLFVNVERDSLVTPCPTHLLETIWEAERALRVFVDIGGRAVARYPREVLATVRHARAARWGVSLNDLEVGSAALALLPVLEPDVVRLNAQTRAMDLARGRLALFAALAEAEQTGAALIMEHVEAVGDESLARASGVRYAQGYHYGRPGPLPASIAMPPRPLRLLERPVDEATPFEIAAEGGPILRTPADLAAVQVLIRDFVALVDAAPNSMFVAVLTTDSPAALSLHAATFARAMADKSALLLILGRDVAVFDDWSTKTVTLPDSHPLLGESCFVAASPQLCTLLAFRQTQQSTGATTWDVVIRQDASACRKVVRRLLAEADALHGGLLIAP
jgi:EAL domain-containing protein (putative c-di-GMP-specific phosphodiesterase class I)